MWFELGEEHRQLRETVRSFGQRSVAPHMAPYEKKEAFPWEIIKEMAGLGFFGAPFPEEYGGAGMDYLAYAVLVEEIGRASASLRSALSAHCGLVASVIYELGTEEQKQRFLTPLAKGEKLGCYCLTEPNSGSDAGSLQTRAQRKGESWLLNGQKIFITNGTVAQVGLVFARTNSEQGARGITAFLVEMDRSGITRNPMKGKLGLRASDTAELVFEDVEVPDSWRLGEEGKGFTVAMKALDNGRLGVAAGSVGLAQMALDLAAKYAQEREQFGRPIGSFQLIQDHIATMAVEVEAARLLTYKAAATKMAGKRNTQEVCMAKLYASEVAVRSAHKAIQIHGGYGYFEEFGVERLLRDSQIATLYEGSTEIQKLIIAQSVLGLKAFT